MSKQELNLILEINVKAYRRALAKRALASTQLEFGLAAGNCNAYEFVLSDLTANMKLVPVFLPAA